MSFARTWYISSSSLMPKTRAQIGRRRNPKHTHTYRHSYTAWQLRTCFPGLPFLTSRRRVIMSSTAFSSCVLIRTYIHGAVSAHIQERYTRTEERVPKHTHTQRRKAHMEDMYISAVRDDTHKCVCTLPPFPVPLSGQSSFLSHCICVRTTTSSSSSPFFSFSFHIPVLPFSPHTLTPLHTHIFNSFTSLSHIPYTPLTPRTSSLITSLHISSRTIEYHTHTHTQAPPPSTSPRSLSVSGFKNHQSLQKPSKFYV